MNALLLIGSLASLWCDTPVYRYAMYRWPASPYELYAFQDENDSDSQAVADSLRAIVGRVRDDADHPANLEFVQLNVNEPDIWRNYPPEVQKAWSTKPADTPASQWQVLLSPQGIVVKQGQIAAETLEAACESEARRKLSEELAAAKAGVLVVLLPGESPAPAPQETEPATTEPSPAAAALQAARDVVQQVADGKAGLYVPPSPSLGAAPGEPPTEAPSEAPQRETGMVVVYREDPSERWLVDCLLAVESDLAESQFKDQPMVFIAYGRGRVLPPYVGKGVTAENLLQDVQFITGACSCTVKDQNPGVDLLIRYDWETASQLMADLFGSEEGNESQIQVQDLIPQLLAPPDSEIVEDSGEPSAGGQQGRSLASLTGDDDGASNSLGPSDPAVNTPLGGDSAESPAGADQLASSTIDQTPGLAGDDDPPTQLHWDVWLVGLGVAGATVILAGAVFLLLRPR